ncbi:HrpB1 family type III secretion system apparatus protein [Trinickia acidisoli]|uniref:HrpB1 family type III secretion system apparatus protein n=1 Tax=Trinickia acidisoli TaxID=2767482 RepID=UPI001A8F6AA3|nr:HrpB1 family type III secretion system apparatus protein [Trinickia acidisoli]
MNEMKLDSVAVRALLSVFSIGLTHASFTDLEDLLIALRALSPDSALADLCEARLLMRSRRWIEASRLIAQVEAQYGVLPKLRVLHAWCLLKLGEPQWRSCIDSALGSSDNGAVAAANALLERVGAAAERK